jgi:hypothetical protein
MASVSTWWSTSTLCCSYALAVLSGSYYQLLQGQAAQPRRDRLYRFQLFLSLQLQVIYNMVLHLNMLLLISTY